jgi:hypothetical protein
VSSAAASDDNPVGVKWGHVEYVLGRPHEYAWIRKQAQLVDANPAIVLYLGAGALGLIVGAVLYYLGYLAGIHSTRRPPGPHP